MPFAFSYIILADRKAAKAMERTKPKRETAHLFDLIFKRIKDYSNVAIINFINGLFGKNHPADSAVEYPETGSVSRSLRGRRSDMIAVIGGAYTYLIEAQINDDENIALRVFEYAFAEGLRARKVSGEDKNAERITVKFPEARIIYWETTSRTPDEAILSLEFPDGGHYDYSVRTLKFLDLEISELEGLKLAILLPFYVLKLRKRVVRAKGAEERAKLGREAKGILDELVAVAERARAAGSIGENDWLSILEHMERIYSELYGCYDEFKEADAVLQEKILTYTEEAKLIGIQEGMKRGMERGMEAKAIDVARNLLLNGVLPDVIARSTGLPMEKIRELMN
jgi:hypothetical protein